jgi:hypothetical protein
MPPSTSATGEELKLHKTGFFSGSIPADEWLILFGLGFSGIVGWVWIIPHDFCRTPPPPPGLKCWYFGRLLQHDPLPAPHPPHHGGRPEGHGDHPGLRGTGKPSHIILSVVFFKSQLSIFKSILFSCSRFFFPSIIL